jgi:hypothetical protein
MAKVGAQRAAELTGRSKSTVQRAMKTGKLSYEIDANDRRVIDVSELERVFGLVPQDSEVRGGRTAVEAELEKATSMLEAERLKMKIRMLEDQLDLAKGQIEDLKEQRDLWQKQAQQVLITSQYSQKQAEELKEELRQREERARIRRQQFEQQQRGARGAKNAVSDAKSAAAALTRDLGIQSLWQKIRGESAGKTAAKPAEAAKGEAKDKAA